MSSVTFRGVTVSSGDVLRALAGFDSVYGDNSNGYDGWLDKAHYKYAMWHEGRVYPPKHILAQVTGLSGDALRTAQRRNEVLRQLGFEVRGK